MEIRDAVEADAERLAALTDAPTDVMRNLVHDRTVRVAVEPDDGDAVGESDDVETDVEAASASDVESDVEAASASDVESDVEAASASDVESDVEAASASDDEADDERGDEDVCGFVSYDATGSTVHVTQLEGEAELCARLLSEPVRFADGEGMSVELLATESADAVRDAAEQAAFDEVGPGPRFDDTETTRFRWTAGE